MSGKKETAKQIKINPRTTWRSATKEKQKISKKMCKFFYNPDFHGIYI